MNYKQIYRKSFAVVFGTGLFFALGCSTTAQAQRSIMLAGGSPAMNYSRVLLKRADVQKELALDAQQKEVLAKLLNQSPEEITVRSMREMPPVKYQDISKLSGEEREKWESEIGRAAGAQAVKFMNEQRREVEAVLRSDQLKRLNEIDLQWRGLLALVNQNLSDKLKISPEHYKIVSEIVADFEVKRIDLLDDSDYANSPLYRKREMLLYITEQKILAVLSDEEKANWSQAIGKPFNFEK